MCDRNLEILMAQMPPTIVDGTLATPLDFQERQLWGGEHLLRQHRVTLAGLSLVRKSEEALRHILRGDVTDAFVCAGQAQRLLQLIEDMSDGEDVLCRPPDAVSRCLFACHLLSQPCVLTVEVDDSDQHYIPVCCHVCIPAWVRHSGVLPELLGASLSYGEYSLLVGTEKHADVGSVRLHTHMGIGISGRFLVPHEVAWCSITCYRGGQVVGAWLLARRWEGDGDIWKLMSQ